MGTDGFAAFDGSLDGRFEAYQKPLFSRGASETNRELQDKAFDLFYGKKRPRAEADDARPNKKKGKAKAAP